MSEEEMARKTDEPERQARPLQQVGKGHTRDIGTAGGGTIPHNGIENTDNAPREESKQQAISPRENKDETKPQTSQSIGGRPPEEPRTNTGDRDPHNTGGQGTNQDIIDPMTSRAPQHVKNQSQAQNN